MKLIQIRGCNASGKTTTVRQFIEKNNFRSEEIFIKGIRTYITINQDNSIVILGRYDKKTGGCDLFENKEHVFNTIIWLIVNIRPKTIIFEGLIYGLTYKFASELSDYVKNYNYKYVGICLYVNPDIAIERLYKRNGGKKINEQYVFSKTKSAISAYKKLALNGYNVKMLDTSNIKENEMFKILEDCINER